MLILPYLMGIFGVIQQPSLLHKVLWAAIPMVSFGLAGWKLSKSDKPKEGTFHRVIMAFITIVAGFLGTTLVAGGTFYLIHFLPKVTRGDVFK